MRACFTRLFFVAAAAVAAVAALVAQSAEKSFLVTVIADKGPVTGLTAADFTVTEGGAARTVTRVEPPPFPLAVSLLVDMTQAPGSMTMWPRELRGALSSFVTSLRAASPDAQISMVEVSSGAVTAAAFDATPTQLDIAIGRLLPAHPADAVMLEAMGAAARTLSTLPTPRRAIVTVDVNSSESINESTMKRVTTDLSQAGATVWSVSVRLPRAGGSRREGALNMITRVSGGLRLVAGAGSGVEAQLKQIADSLSSQYLVTFTRPDQGPIKDLSMTARGGRVNLTPMTR